MKKLLLGTLLLGTLLTGCGMKAGEVETVVTKTIYDQAIESSEELIDAIEDYLCYTETELEEAKSETIKMMEETYIEEGISEEAKDRCVELIKSVEYDNSFVRGYDYDSLLREYIELAVEYGYVYGYYKDLTIDEIYEDVYGCEII